MTEYSYPISRKNPSSAAAIRPFLNVIKSTLQIIACNRHSRRLQQMAITFTKDVFKNILVSYDMKTLVIPLTRILNPIALDAVSKGKDMRP